MSINLTEELSLISETYSKEYNEVVQDYYRLFIGSLHILNGTTEMGMNVLLSELNVMYLEEIE